MLKPSVVGVMGVLAVVPVSASAGIIGDAVLNPANGHYYAQVSVPGNIPWHVARTAAEGWTHNGFAGHLATITSAQENQFIVDHLEEAAIGMYWLGGFQAFDEAPEHDPAAGWQWVTGEEWVYTNWMAVTSEPNDAGASGEDVLRLWRSDWWSPTWGGQHALGQWNDDPVSSTARGYVVEFVPAPGVMGTLGLGLMGLSRRRR